MKKYEELENGLQTAFINHAVNSNLVRNLFQTIINRERKCLLHWNMN